MFRAVLSHDFRQLIVHVFLNPGGCVFCFWSFFANDLGLYRPHCGECLGDTF